MTKVVRFPPLPAIPEPFGSRPDERQRGFERIADAMSEAVLSESGRVAVVNTLRGFRASAVDVGSLQQMLGNAISDFRMQDVRDRWSDDIFPWFRQAIMSWVQRCKAIHFSLEQNGVRIELETQDDRGYYRYVFDVFPGREN